MKKIREHIKMILIVTAVSIVANVATDTVQVVAEQEKQRKEANMAVREIESLADLNAGVAEVLDDIDCEIVAAEKDVFTDLPDDYCETDGFTYYTIPEEYRLNGGYLPETMQQYTYSICGQEGVSYALILAMIERESGYKYDSVGDSGESVGYMQIMKKWHAERMEEVGVTDLQNPYQNIRVGVRCMKELIAKYGTIQDALTVYNYGASGAMEHLWSKGVFVHDYNKSIMSRMKEIEEEMGR